MDLNAYRRGIDAPVADARLVEDVPWPRRIRLDLRAQMRDVDVQIVRLLPVRRSPDLTQDRRVREQLSLVLGQELQEVVFDGRQGDSPPVDRHGSLLEVDPEPGELQDGLD